MNSAVLSPLGLLLRHSRSTDPSAEEVVLFTFNHDLAFFERSALGLLQQTGARITVVADSRVAHHDLYAVRRAGIAYLPGLAWCPGAFHPKLFVMPGTETTTVARGPVNLSTARGRGDDHARCAHAPRIATKHSAPRRPPDLSPARGPGPRGGGCTRGRSMSVSASESAGVHFVQSRSRTRKWKR